MITYRSELWNVVIVLLKELKKYSYFVDNFQGRYSKRIDGIYERALKKCSLSSNDWKLLLETMQLITEKDITDEMREIFDEAYSLDMSCVTSSDGENIYRIAREKLHERKVEEENRKAIEKAKKELDEATLLREKYLADQEATLRLLEEKEFAYQELQKKIEQEKKEKKERESDMATSEPMEEEIENE